jgi:hypothetical protein
LLVKADLVGVYRRDFRLVLAPKCVEGALSVHTAVRVCAEEVPLALDDGSRESLAAQTVIVGQ